MPTGIPDDQIQAWLHGPLNGTVAIPAADKVTFITSYLPSKTYFEGRVIFPTNIISNSQAATGTLSKEQIQNQEQGFIIKTIAQKKFNQAGYLFTLLLGSGLLLLTIKVIWQAWQDFVKHGKDLPLPPVNLAGTLWEPPSDRNP